MGGDGGHVAYTRHTLREPFQAVPFQAVLVVGYEEGGGAGVIGGKNLEGIHQNSTRTAVMVSYTVAGYMPARIYMPLTTLPDGPYRDVCEITASI